MWYLVIKSTVWGVYMFASSKCDWRLVRVMQNTEIWMGIFCMGRLYLNWLLVATSINQRYLFKSYAWVAYWQTTAKKILEPSVTNRSAVWAEALRHRCIEIILFCKVVFLSCWMKKWRSSKKHWLNRRIRMKKNDSIVLITQIHSDPMRRRIPQMTSKSSNFPIM